MSTKPLKFKCHFNRVNMQRGNPNVWTVHTSRQCFQGKRIHLEVPTKTVFDPLGRQPRAFFEGYGRVFKRGEVIYVT